MNKTLPKTEFVTAQWLAAKHGFTDRYWTRLAAGGKIPGAYQPHGPGGAWRFDPAAFKEWWRSKQARPDQWHPSIDGERRGGRRYRETGNFTADRSKQTAKESLKAAYARGCQNSTR